MKSANRKAKLSKYVVTLHREVEFTAKVEIMARSVEEAQDLAVNTVDELRPSPWREGDITAMSAKAKIVRE